MRVPLDAVNLNRSATDSKPKKDGNADYDPIKYPIS